MGQAGESCEFSYRKEKKDKDKVSSLKYIFNNFKSKHWTKKDDEYIRRMDQWKEK